MTWVRQAQRPAHTCNPPSRTSVGYVGVPVGALGDLWRCDDCRRLWRIGHACDSCDRRKRAQPHAGGHAIGGAWRPATLWQRILHWRR